MKRKVILPLGKCRIIEGLSDQYKDSYRVAVPDDVFFDMIVSLGIDCMKSILENKADSMKVEVNEK